jgi:hypothetical protein
MIMDEKRKMTNGDCMRESLISTITKYIPYEREFLDSFSTEELAVMCQNTLYISGRIYS